MTQDEGVRLARKIVLLVMSDMEGRCGILDGVDDDVMEEMRAELVELVIDALPFTDDGTR
jgi:hypothetical protein